ncbi:hypothetical protein [Sphingobacterium sp. xlx-130]|uniref:hypothetical protein n=1 Tax=Sphingobacterium sp. xlx-130 TaxID=2654323 RepID=UPI0013DA328A|nr:hypothetical protein [Sphingobacterium sp. xlx-130]
MKATHKSRLWRKREMSLAVTGERPMVQLIGVFNDQSPTDNDHEPKCFFTGL